MNDAIRRIPAPRFEPLGWMQWPENEEYSLLFMKILAAAQEGASTISECFLCATRIVPGDSESWYREWKRLADVGKVRADAAFATGCVRTAQSNWLRASNYYRAAGEFLAEADERRHLVFDQMEECSHLYLNHMTPEGEIIKIPYDGVKYMSAYFLRAPDAPPKTPVVVCFGAKDQCKDDQLFKTFRHALPRGLSLLLVDLPGQGATVLRNMLNYRHDVEIPIGRCMDYLMTRDDVDSARVALYGEGLGGAYASRAASFDGRVAAAVCDGGIWDYREKVLFQQWNRGEAGSLKGHSLSQGITCPILVTIGERDFIDLDEAMDYYNRCKEAGVDIQVRIFFAEETGASHAQADNPTLAQEFIFDWLAAKLQEQ